jgi:hypothetical protein
VASKFLHCHGLFRALRSFENGFLDILDLVLLMLVPSNSPNQGDCQNDVGKSYEAEPAANIFVHRFS